MGVFFSFFINCAISNSTFSSLFVLRSALARFHSFWTVSAFPISFWCDLLNPFTTSTVQGAVGCGSWLDMILHYSVHCISFK